MSDILLIQGSKATHIAKKEASKEWKGRPHLQNLLHPRLIRSFCTRITDLSSQRKRLERSWVGLFCMVLCVLSNESIEIQRIQIFTVMFFGFSGERLKSTSICIALLFAFDINFKLTLNITLRMIFGFCHLLLFVNSTNYFQIVRTWYFFSHLFEYSIYLLTKGPGAEFLSQTKSIFFPLLFLSI